MSILIKGVSLPRENEYLDLVITRDGKVCCYDAEGVSVAEAVEVEGFSRRRFNDGKGEGLFYGFQDEDRCGDHREAEKADTDRL